MSKNIEKMLEQISETDYKQNVQLISKTYGALNYRNGLGETIIHDLCKKEYDDFKKFHAIFSLIKNSIMSPNVLDWNGYNFIQVAIINSCSEMFILNCISNAINFGLDINYAPRTGETIMHVALINKYNGDISTLFKLLYNNGFDISKKNKYSQNIYDLSIQNNKYSKEIEDAFIKEGIIPESVEVPKESIKPKLSVVENMEICEDVKGEETADTVSKNIPKNVAANPPLLTTTQLKEFEKFGTVLNFNKYKTSPTIAREKELENLIITLAQDLTSPIIVGDSGVGKSALVHELVYRIKRGEVPNFLKDRIVFEINPGQVVAGCKYVGDFEKNMTECMKLCKKHNVIAFIDEIHTIYGLGSGEKKDNDMAQMLKYYIDRSSFKVIGATTTKEYEEYFNTDALKRRFEKIVIKEPENEVLYQIVDKVLDDYCKNKKIKFENKEIKKKIIDMLFEVTEKKHRTFDDRVNNPALVISIIDKAFAIPVTFDQKIIIPQHFIQSIEFNNRLYESAKESAIKCLNSDKSNNYVKTKVIQFIPKK